LDLLDEATHPEQQAEIAAVVLQGTGLAHVCLVTGALTITKARIDVNIPKKRTGSSQHAKATTKFFEAIYKAILLHIDFTKVKCIVVGSPGFLANDWLEYTKLESVRRNDRPFIENKSKFVLCKASSGHKHALEEIFSDPTIAAQMTETKVAREVVILQKFMRLMDTDADRAYYGYDHVAKVDEQLAIDSLLVTDELFRASDVATRKRYVGLVESVRANGGQVYVFSSMHVSGQQLQQVSGIAAILRYPLPDLDQLEELAASADYQPSAAAYDDRRYDAERRIREDLLDMGL
jgi:protein pelota